MTSPRDPAGEHPPPPTAAKIFIIDDHELFATSLLLALREAGLDATYLPVASLTQLLSATAIDDPGLLLLDLDLGTQSSPGPRLRGADLVGQLRERGWRILVITGSEDETQIAAAIAGGALGVVDKTDDFDHLLEAVSKASTGRSLITNAERDEWIVRYERYSTERRERAERLSRLTPREREVLDLMADGYRAAAIADKFVVSIATVRAQIRSILAKTQCDSQLEAVALIRPRTTEK